MTPAISVVICTHNRSPYLRKALESLARQEGALPPWEVLVVDNASTDETRQVVAAARGRLPDLTYVFEPRLGLSVARNRGVQEAHGPIVAFLDDDAVAGPHWLAATIEAFGGEDVVAVAGRITLIWSKPRPWWLPEQLEGYYTQLDLGDDPVALGPSRYPLGANMSVRAHAFATAGGFRTDLGRRGTRGLLSNEEKEFFGRVRALGGSLVYAPRAHVGHHVPPERASVRWLVRRLLDQGRSEALLESAPSHTARAAHLRGAAVGLARAVAGGKRRLARDLVHGLPAPALVTELTRAARWLGYATQHARLLLRD